MGDELRVGLEYADRARAHGIGLSSSGARSEPLAGRIYAQQGAKDADSRETLEACGEHRHRERPHGRDHQRSK
jgi:hypothetical protein